MKIAIVGCGGLGSVVAESVMRSGAHELVGFFDDSPDAPAQVNGIKVLGPRTQLADVISATGIEGFFVALGNNSLRRKIAAEMVDFSLEAVTLVDSTATLSPLARLGDGVFIAAGCIIGPCVEIGDFSVVNTASVIEHDARVASDCYIGPMSLLEARAEVSGSTSLPARSFLDKDQKV